MPVLYSDIRWIKKFNNENECFVVITNIEEFSERIKKHLVDAGLPFMIHCGVVKYNRGREVSKDDLNNQYFEFNVFQKDFAYRHQNEYRLSLSPNDPSLEIEDTLMIKIGNCEDIMKIVHF